jgi:uncharacterized glyoxalase superfamily protein PhnB
MRSPYVEIQHLSGGNDHDQSIERYRVPYDHPVSHRPRSGRPDEFPGPRIQRSRGTPRDAPRRLDHARRGQDRDSIVMMAELANETRLMPASLYLTVDDADTTYERALEAGATSIRPPEDQPYGRSAGVEDASGNTRWITAPLPEPGADPRPHRQAREMSSPNSYSDTMAHGALLGYTCRWLLSGSAHEPHRRRRRHCNPGWGMGDPYDWEGQQD